MQKDGVVAECQAELSRNARARSSLRWTLTKADGVRNQSENHRRERHERRKGNTFCRIRCSNGLGDVARGGVVLLPYLWRLDTGRHAAAPADRDRAQNVLAYARRTGSLAPKKDSEKLRGGIGQFVRLAVHLERRARQIRSAVVQARERWCFDSRRRSGGRPIAK